MSLPTRALSRDRSTFGYRALCIAALVLLVGTSTALARVEPAVSSPTSNVPLVGPALRRERARIHAELAARRAMNLARFEAYVARGVYPENTYREGLANVLIDARGNICAAATMMTEDGLGDLVRELARADNFLALGTVREGPVLEWILGSGFTQEELAAIQLPFSMVEPADEPLADAPEVTERQRLRALYQAEIRMLRRDRRVSLEIATGRVLAGRMRQPG